MGDGEGDCQEAGCRRYEITVVINLHHRPSLGVSRLQAWFIPSFLFEEAYRLTRSNNDTGSRGC
jgi:hypothetical protein